MPDFGIDVELELLLRLAFLQAHQGRHFDGSVRSVAHAQDKLAHQKQQQCRDDQRDKRGKQNGDETFYTQLLFTR